MSTLDPFTQKLLERTQARKEAAKLNRGNLAGKPAEPSKIQRQPLSEKTNDSPQTTSPIKGKKRQSTDGDSEASFEKRTKENESLEPLFNHRHNKEYVVPSNAGCTPKKVNCGSSLSNRLAHLNHEYEEKFALDFAEQQRKKEGEQIQEERRQQHAKIQEEERQRILQEKIFGKERAANMRENTTPKKNEKRAAPNPPSSSASKLQQQHKTTTTPTPSSPQKRQAPKAPSAKTSPKRTAPQPPKATTENAPSAKSATIPKVKIQEPADKKKKLVAGDNKLQKIINDRKSTEDEEKKCSASVGSKMSIFEEKMKQEREARQKELETETRLRQKTSRKPLGAGKPIAAGSNDPKKVQIVEEDLQSNTPKVGQAKEEEDEVVFAITTKKERVATPQKKKEGLLGENAVETPRKRSDFSSASSMQATPSKNFTGSISSPQPIDCTEDTNVSDSKAFDISEILKAAEEEKQLSPTSVKVPRHDRTPMRSSTMKVQAGETPVVAKPIIDIDITPVQFDEEEDLSEFSKQIRSKGKQLVKNAKDDGKNKQRPQKPPRHNVEFPPTYEEFLATKKDGQIPLGPFGSVNTGNSNNNKTKDDNNNKQSKDVGAGGAIGAVTPTYLVVESKKPKDRKKTRRSVSFSEGTSPVKSPTKSSGYNRVLSAQYDARAAFDKPDMVHSKRDQIQNLLEKAACQQNIVLQTSQALNVAENSTEDKSGLPEVIEGERLLLLATEKRTACLEEVRLLKTTDSVEFLNTLDDTQPCKASLALTDLKIPLHHDFVNALRAGRLDLGVFHFVVLACCGSKNVFCTKVVSSYDEMEGHSLIVSDNLYLTEVPHDFTLTLKVYGLHTKKTDHTTRAKRTHSATQSPGNLKSLFSKRKDEDVFNCASPQTVFRTSGFKLVGETKVNLGMLGGGGKYVLTKVPSNCPLEGFIQVRVGCRPQFTATSSGFLTIQEDIGGYTAWNRRWCNMKDNKVLYWRYPDDEETKEPLGCIDLRCCTDKSVNLLQRDVCARPHTFELNLKRAAKPGDESNLVKTVEGKVVVIKVWICADNKDDRNIWMDAVNKQLSDSRAWVLKKTVQKYSKSIEEIVSEENGVAIHV